MKEFFNRFNREKHFMVLLLWYDIDRWINDPGCQLKDEEKEALAEAKDLIWETCGEGLLRRLDRQYGEALIRDLDQNMAVVERQSKIRDYHIVCKQESVDRLGDLAIMICNNQSREACIKYKKCNLYQAYVDASVPVCCLETDACPYRGESYNKKTKTWAEVVPIDPIERDYKQAVCQQCGEVWYAEDGMDLELYKRCNSCGGRLGEWK